MRRSSDELVVAMMLKEKAMPIKAMKAVRQPEFGGPDVLRYEDTPMLELKPGEVLVRRRSRHRLGWWPEHWSLLHQHEQRVMAQLMHMSSTGSLVIFSAPRVTATQEVLWYILYGISLWLGVAIIVRNYGKRLTQQIAFGGK